MIAAEAFLEWADVFATCMARARQMLKPISRLDATWCGHRRTGRAAGACPVPRHRGGIRAAAVVSVLESRLRGRSADSEQAMQRRLQTARDEVAAFAEYDYVVVNDELEASVDRLRAIVLAERSRLRSMRGMAEDIVQTFIRK